MDERTIAKIVLGVSLTIGLFAGVFAFVPNKFQSQSFALLELMAPFVGTSILVLRILNNRELEFAFHEKLDFWLLLLVGLHGLYQLFFPTKI